MRNYLGVNDNYLPTVPKPSLQQYDNYQIHDLYCEDIYYSSSLVPVLFRSFLAVERVSPYGEIECDFNQIAMDYP
jgi:hypothetical protein